LNFKTTLHDIIRERYCEKNQISNLATKKDYSTQMYPYYTRKLEDNLYEPLDPLHQNQYNKGLGGELREGKSIRKRPMKMKSIRSSSALAYNIFGNKLVEIKSNSFGLPAKVYKIAYETPHRLIKSGNRTVSAWADVVLLSLDKEDCVIVESKMFEWLLDKPKSISEKYLLKENYISQDVGCLIMPTIKQLLSGKEIIKKGQKYFSPINDQYDGIQILLHIIGFLTEIELGKYKNVKRVHIVNMIWTLNNTELLGTYSNKYKKLLEKEKKQSELFKKYFDEHLSTIFTREYGIVASFNAAEHFQMIDALNIKENQRNYLISRY